MTRPAAPARLAVIGAGDRGRTYASLAAASGAVIAAVAEPDDTRRERFGERFEVPAGRRSESWDRLELTADDVDGIVIATMDDLHVDPALRFAPLGVPLLLEKPIGCSWSDCEKLRDGLPQSAPPLLVAHVLRYAPYTRVLRSLLAEGAVGEIVSIHHLEPVGFWHFAHSFTRGNWRSTAAAAPFMVSKACHDIDWVMHLIGSECVAVSSFGALNHFRPEFRPDGAADRCVDCSVDCVYDARSIYLDMAGAGDFSHPVSTITEDTTVAGVQHALEHTQFGECVYHCDNDVIDTQVASLLFSGGQTASITVTAFTEARGRHSVIAGTSGEATVDHRGVEVYSFRTRRRRFYPAGTDAAAISGPDIDAGHAGGDAAMIEYFLGEIASPTEAGGQAFADALRSHQVAFAVEESRLRQEVLDPRELPALLARPDQHRSCS
ncbi:MAG: Gfo/Idh/MocA family oxidoreductase [Acidimicrobiaceae bacterium]|nr:Gfo/Idh/MocA family oxidoreductase [Acidimicrobiaceae bacterium]